MERRGQAWVLLIVLGLQLLVLFSCICPVAANPLTTVTLKIQEEASVDISPGSPGIVTFTGTVTCLKFGPDTVEVDLMPGTTCGGEVCVVPPNFVFSQSSGQERSENFTVTAKVKQDVLCDETFTVTVGGSYKQSGIIESIDDVVGTIIIEQYYLVSIVHEKILNISVKAELPVAGKNYERVSLKIDTPEDKHGLFKLQMSITSKGSLGTSNPVKIVKVIPLGVVERSITEKISSIIFSPMVLALIVIVIVVAIIIKVKRG